MSSSKPLVDWAEPDWWCPICSRGMEGCFHTPEDVEGEQA
jgi:hypothetical protein